MTETGAFQMLLGPKRDSRVYGVVIGIVTNNQDPDKWGRVKVRFPWLGDEDESYWARIATPMAGNNRGMYFIPEVDDEVLVAFHHGLIDQPFVVGALWNGKDAPPASNDNGKNDVREIRSRSGHVLRLTDADGQETVEIIDKTGNNKITFHSSDNKINIEAQSDITIQSSTGKLILQGKGVEITSMAGVTVKATANMDLQAINFDLQASGIASIEGTLVKLNS